MITVNYGIRLRVKKNRKKSQHRNCQGLQLDLKKTQHKKIREAIRAKHAGWILEGYVVVENKKKKMKTCQSITVPIFNKKEKIIINREELIEQITTALHNTSTDRATFEASNILLGTCLSAKDHALVSRL